jgi:arylsulfatase
MDKKPNILLIHTDQQRGDCLGCAGHPVLETPIMDNIAANGTRFSNFYTPCPVCVAARCSMMFGQSPQKHRILSNSKLEIPDSVPSLPQVLRENGYQTYHVGRDMHQHPPRKRYGFDDMEIISGDYRNCYGEYEEWFKQHAPKGAADQGQHQGGILHNDWNVYPWQLPDYMHPTNWTVSRAMRFLERRDNTCPFFLSVGFMAPHPPLQPPNFYLERYLRTGVPDPVVGDWATADWGNNADRVAPYKLVLNEEETLTTRAAYYGLINHVDTQLRRLLNGNTGLTLGQDLIVIFVSDHGEMLGDHYMWRKCRALEPSARVPFIISAPDEFKISRNRVIDYPATHADIMPTILGMLELDIPDTVDGENLYPLLSDGEQPEREYIHIEYRGVHQGLTDGKYKYIWDIDEDYELFFDLKKDPDECKNLLQDPAYKDMVECWRGRLIEALKDRPEGFVKNGVLTKTAQCRNVIPE